MNTGGRASYNLQTSFLVRAHLFYFEAFQRVLDFIVFNVLEHFQRTLSILHGDTERKEKGASLVISCHNLTYGIYVLCFPIIIYSQSCVGRVFQTLGGVFSKGTFRWTG